MESFESYLRYLSEIKRKAISSFCEHIIKNKFTLPDIFDFILFQPPAPTIFMIGLEHEEEFVIFSRYEKNGNRSKENRQAIKKEKKKIQKRLYYKYEKDKYEQIKGFFENHNGKKFKKLSNRMTYCRCFGKIPTENGVDYRIYYYASIPQNDQFNNMYLSTLEKEYYKWIYHKFAIVVDSFDFENVSYKPEEKKSILKKSEMRFHQDVKKLLEIDLNMVIELSGTYYEGSPCRSRLVFSYSPKTRADSINLEDPVAFVPKNTRLVRKLIQMGQENYDLLLTRKSGKGGWMVEGICPSTNSDTSFGACLEVSFRLIRHMVWEMEINKEIVVRYECGQYKIITNDVYMAQFRSVYKKIFKTNVPPKLEKTFEVACQQEHGTVLLVEKDAKDESKRLIKESIGIRIRDGINCSSLHKGLTAIDGAVLVDQYGHCFGAGFILDSSRPLSGRKDRGSRYNSTARYVWSRRDRKKATIAVIVSEDKSTDIISTLDDLSEV